MGNYLCCDANKLYTIESIISALKNRQLEALRLIFQNTVSSFDEFYELLTIYHYVVIYSINYNYDDLEALCNLLTTYSHYIRGVTSNSFLKRDLIIVKNGKYYISAFVLPDESYDRPLLRHTLFGTSAMTLAYILNSSIKDPSGANKNLKLVITTLNNIINPIRYEPTEKSLSRPLLKDEKSKCSICMVNTIDTILKDCCHVSTCITCANKLVTCPICRGAIRSRERAILS